MQNLKLTSSYLGVFIDKNKTSKYPISFKHGIYCSIDCVKNEKEIHSNNLYKISPKLVSQFNYGKLHSKLKLTIDSIRIYNEYSFKKMIDFKILPPVFEKTTIGIYWNVNIN